MESPVGNITLGNVAVFGLSALGVYWLLGRLSVMQGSAVSPSSSPLEQQGSGSQQQGSQQQQTPPPPTLPEPPPASGLGSAMTPGKKKAAKAGIFASFRSPFARMAADLVTPCMSLAYMPKDDILAVCAVEDEGLRGRLVEYFQNLDAAAQTANTVRRWPGDGNLFASGQKSAWQSLRRELETAQWSGAVWPYPAMQAGDRFVARILSASSFDF